MGKAEATWLRNSVSKADEVVRLSNKEMGGMEDHDNPAFSEFRCIKSFLLFFARITQNK